MGWLKGLTVAHTALPGVGIAGIFYFIDATSAAGLI